MSRHPGAAPLLQQLRDQVRHLERPTARVDLPSHPAVADLPTLRGGGSHEVTDLGLAMALMAGPTSAGQWCAVVGVPDFGAEAAAGLGVDLARTVLVPDPGEQWLEVVAALTDVLPLVLLRPGGRVGESVAAKLGARLRRRGATLLVHAPLGTWPRCEVRLGPATSTWHGVGVGRGRLRSRELTVQVREGAAPARPVSLVLGGGADARPVVRPAAVLQPQPVPQPVAQPVPQAV